MDQEKIVENLKKIGKIVLGGIITIPIAIVYIPLLGLRELVRFLKS